MKKLEEIETLINRQPFRPFVIETIGGEKIGVQTSGHIKLPPARFDSIVVFAENGLVYLIDEAGIASIAST